MCFSKFTKINYLLAGLMGFFLFSCSDKKGVDASISEIPVDFKIERFDQLFYDTPTADFPALKKRFPFLFPAQFDDAFWMEKKADTLFVELHDEVQKKFDNLDQVALGLKGLFQHIKHYYPEENPKRVITLISEVDIESKAIYADSLVLISLDTYLGKDHRFYQGFPEYLRPEFEADQILPDVADAFISTKIARVQDKTLLGQMIFQGKLLYAKQQLLPELSDEVIVMYTQEQLKWCIANEEQMWRYFVNDKLLYSTDYKLQTRFIQPSPFSKYYLDIDADSPGRTGAWLGWQIVRSYMKNNNVTLQTLLQMDAKEIFEQSRYKPKK
ncbi:gliding motility lipoprotein GldB [Flavobacterium sp. JP2137]|uniref:gliding motility lipoprotein GldB n=1 Tax=Flavobacterium sp. JP2137 TaxID=3414510 RepID=UPI003D2F9F98